MHESDTTIGHRAVGGIAPLDACAAMAPLRSSRHRPSPLSGVPFHGDVDGIVRCAPDDFPLHVAVHDITDVVEVPSRYVDLHLHPADEINLLIAPEGALVYELETAEGVQEVVSPATVRIPAGAPHSMNLVRGSGVFVCVILAHTEHAFVDGAAPAAVADRSVNVTAGLATVAPSPIEIDVRDTVGAVEPVDAPSAAELTADTIWVLLGDPGAMQVRWRAGDHEQTVASPASVHARRGDRVGRPAISGHGSLVQLVIREALGARS